MATLSPFLKMGVVVYVILLNCNSPTRDHFLKVSSYTKLIVLTSEIYVDLVENGDLSQLTSCLTSSSCQFGQGWRRHMYAAPIPFCYLFVPNKLSLNKKLLLIIFRSHCVRSSSALFSEYNKDQNTELMPVVVPFRSLLLLCFVMKNKWIRLISIFKTG